MITLSSCYFYSFLRTRFSNAFSYTLRQMRGIIISDKDRCLYGPENFPLLFVRRHRLRWVLEPKN